MHQFSPKQIGAREIALNEAGGAKDKTKEDPHGRIFKSGTGPRKDYENEMYAFSYRVNFLFTKIGQVGYQNGFGIFISTVWAKLRIKQLNFREKMVKIKTKNRGVLFSEVESPKESK